MTDDKTTGRLRWASQRHPKGRTRKNTARSVFRRLSRASDTNRPQSGEADLAHTGQNFGGSLPPNGDPGAEYPVPPSPTTTMKPVADEEGSKTERRRIYFNMRLPPEETHDDGTPLHWYPRNKIRTAKYTPLTFVPKNLYFQFHNIANMYFLFIVILQVSSPASRLILDIPHLWRSEPWSWRRAADRNSRRHSIQRCHGRLASYPPRQRTQQYKDKDTARMAQRQCRRRTYFLVATDQESDIAIDSAYQRATKGYKTGSARSRKNFDYHTIVRVFGTTSWRLRHGNG